MTCMAGHQELHCFIIIQPKLFRPFQRFKGLVQKVPGTVQIQTSTLDSVPELLCTEGAVNRGREHSNGSKHHTCFTIWRWR